MLTRTERFEIDSATGLSVRVTTVRRGILRTDTRNYDLSNLAAFDGESAKESLLHICEQLRDRLEKVGIPTDRIPVWIREGEDDWRPRTDADKNLNFDGKYRIALWFARMKEMTEPLSVERSAGNLLWDLLRLLEMKGVDPYLWHVGQVMEKYVSFRLSGTVNRLATIGLAAQRARATGPATKQKRAADRRAVIWALTQDYWAKNPHYRRDAINTASQIADSVNKDLRIKQLLPGSGQGLSPKTIADHIRAGLKD